MGRADCLVVSYDESGKDIPIMVIARPNNTSDNGLNYEIIRTVVGNNARELYESLTEDDY